MLALRPALAGRGRYVEGEAAVRAAAGRMAVPPQPTAEAAESLRPPVRALIWQSNFGRAQGSKEQAGQLQQQAQELLNRPGLSDQNTRFERALLQQMEARRRYVVRLQKGTRTVGAGTGPVP